MEKRKVLFIMTALNGGGAERALLTMLKGFDYDRFEVSLCIISNAGRYLGELPSQVVQVPIYARPNTLLERIGFILYSRWRIPVVERRATRNAIRNHYDTIVSYCQGRALKYHGYLLDRADRNISWVHGDMYTTHASIGPNLSLKDERRIYEAMDEVVFVSYEAQRQFKKLGYAIKKDRVIYNPIPVAEIQRYILPSKV